MIGLQGEIGFYRLQEGQWNYKTYLGRQHLIELCEADQKKREKQYQEGSRPA